MRVLFKLLIAFVPFFGFGQQEYSFTHYFEANSFYNPAATGSMDAHRITALMRKQWVGFEGSPITGGVVYDTRLSKFNMGLGGYVFTDKIGATSMTNFAVNYSYALQFGNDSRLAFGIDAGADMYNTDYDALIYWDDLDPMFNGQNNTVFVPRAGAGIQFYGDAFYVGFAVPRLINFNNESAISIRANDLPSIVSNYYLSAGYRFSLGESFELQTNVLGKYTGNVRPQGDISLMGTYRKLVGIGVGYKSLGFGSIFAQYCYKDIFKIGYNFDITLTDVSNYSTGSHEVMLQYIIPKKDKGSKSSLGM
jgi:type IX secretion system PorP/SprF family membrane protein